VGASLRSRVSKTQRGRGGTDSPCQFSGAHVPERRDCFAISLWWVQLPLSPPIRTGDDPASSL